MKPVLSLVLLLSASLTAPGADLVDPIQKTRRGVALEGYDTVAYFEQGRPVKGSDRFTFSWMGASWQFASATHRDLFAADPEKYAPQFGGYCSYAVSEGYTAEIDPQAWKIVDGKLYLNYSKSVQQKWQETMEKRIEDANRNWPRLHR
jgi:hypothetical protein